MPHRSVPLFAAVLLGLVGCAESRTAPADADEGRRLAARFEQLADAVGDSGTSPTADALRHAAEVVRLVGHATPITLTIDGSQRGWLAVAEQLDFPEITCSVPTADGAATDSLVPPAGGGGGGGGCTQTGTRSMRTLIAWEPERMSEVVRITAEPGSSEVRSGIPDVMAGLPGPSVSGDTAVTGGGSLPGFMGEYLVQDRGSFWTTEGNQSNALEEITGACTEESARFDWAEFSCSAARLRFQFEIRVTGGVPLDLRTPGSPAATAESHELSAPSTAVDGVRLTVTSWTQPVPPEPGPEPTPGPGPDPTPVDSTGRG